MVEARLRLHEGFNAPTDDFALCDSFSDVRELELFKFGSQPGRTAVKSSRLQERSTREEAAMEPGEEHGSRLKETRR